MTTAVHRCIAAAACRKPDTADDTRQGALTEHANTLCPPCRTHIEAAVHQLPRDWAELRHALGEHTHTTGSKIRSTPTPATPISTRKEALMAGIVDMADRAAAVVSNTLHTGQPSARRRPHPEAVLGSIAWCAAQNARPDDAQTVAAAIAIVEPDVELLAAAPPEPALVWKKPHRCDTHHELIETADANCRQTAEAISPSWDADISALAVAQKQLAAAFALAGGCDDCNGWGQFGQERELVELSGLDIALALVELHNQARAELGLTRLRHRYPMPCPRCGTRVGRDDGQTIITCDDRDTCRASWTEREYQFLAGLITQERLDMEILKWLLAESYWRLDDTQRRINLITSADAAALNLPGAGAIIVEAVRQALDGHPTPEQRVIATDRQATEQRQTTEDNWNWSNETPYRPPKPKPKKATPPSGPPIHPGSLTMLIDTIVDVVTNGDARCRDCNLIPCDCQ